MVAKQREGFDWVSLILGILFIVASLIVLQDPVGDLIAIAVMIAVFAILKGIFEIILRNKVKKYAAYTSKLPILIGIIDIVIGIFLLFNMDASIIALPFVFAFWFIIDSVLKIFTADRAKVISKGYYWFFIIANILGVIVGLFLLFNPIFSALTISFFIGFYFMMIGITEIIYAFR
ncbi:HdeD family acid-resistance protein [Oceanobacillus timonensis]|uniref:HdeD family acid-resistance protein n=1 Tax=Oceanobacillus timonensis TaxID=1926285 RepID=UPI0009BB2823|nr:DUF308 domain-containing protein [Oceanobacillus timonensis]